MAHSSVRSLEGTDEACASAFVAHAEAWVRRCVRVGGVEMGKEDAAGERVDGEVALGFCCAREVERLFTGG